MQPKKNEQELCDPIYDAWDMLLSGNSKMRKEWAQYASFGLRKWEEYGSFFAN